jgi:GNAT superfamily N-acetyltransferase
LEDEGLVVTAADETDRRKRIAQLTPSGRAEFAAYERLSDAKATAMIDTVKNPDIVLDAMDRVVFALRRDDIVFSRTDPTHEDARGCLAKFYAELNHRFAGGFRVELSCDPDAGSMLPPHGAFLVAYLDGVALGCGALKGTDKGYGEIKRVWIAPAARGLGLARMFMQALEDQARDLGIGTLRLDTNSALHEAVSLYRNSGWTKIDRFNDDPYPDHFFEKHLTPPVS